MKIYIVYDICSGFYAAFDSRVKMNDFLLGEKILFLKEIGKDYLIHEDYEIYTCELNNGWSCD